MNLRSFICGRPCLQRLQHPRHLRHPQRRSCLSYLSYLPCLLGLAMATPALHGNPPIDFMELPWETRRIDNGISIATAEVGGSRFRAFRAEALLDASLPAVLAVLRDTGASRQWVHRCMESRQLARLAPDEHIGYQITKVPFPFADRESIFRIVTERTGENTAVVEMQALADHPAAPTADSRRVRLRHSRGRYELEATAEGTRMVWYQHVDPGGRLPAMLVNRMLVDVPFATLGNLRRVARQPRYANAMDDRNGVNPQHKTVAFKRASVFGER